MANDLLTLVEELKEACAVSESMQHTVMNVAEVRHFAEQIAAALAPVSLPKPDLWRDGKSIKGYTADPGEGPWYSAETVRSLLRTPPAPPAGISPAPLAGEWRPIETAPRSVQPILVLKEGRRMAIETGHYAHNMMHAAKVDGEECGFTHWMPLPAAPRADLNPDDELKKRPA
jgi:hypothetical protein